MTESKTKRKTAAERKAEKAAESKGRLFKYMGTAHVRIIEKGDTFGNQYPDGIEATLQWDIDDGHLIDSTDYPEVSDEAWDLLADEGGFQEVTGRKTMPRSQGEDLWRAREQNSNLVAPTGVAGEAGPGVHVGGGGGGTGGGGGGTGVTAGSGTGVTGDASTS